MLKSQRLRPSILAVILWASVSSGVLAQPFTEGIPNETVTDTVTESVNTEADNSLSDLVFGSGNDSSGGLLGIGQTTRNALSNVIEQGQKALEASSLAKRVFQSLTGNNLDPAIDGITDLLVLYGIIDPQTAAGGNGTLENNPSRFDLEPNTPREVYALARNESAIREELHQKLSGMVLSAEGQEVLVAEEELGDLAQEESIESQTDITEIVGVSQEQASANIQSAGDIQEIGATAQTDESSQQILKRVALQQAHSAEMKAQASQQLSGLTAASAQQNRSLGAIASLGVVQNRKLRVLQTLQASGNSQQAQANFLLEAQKHGIDLKADIQAISTNTSLLVPIIPGMGGPR